MCPWQNWTFKFDVNYVRIYSTWLRTTELIIYYIYIIYQPAFSIEEDGL